MDKQLKKSQVAQITYEKDSKGGEPTSRTVIPTYVPGDFVRAVDITELSQEQQDKMVDLYQQYQRYCDMFMSTMFNFETWLEHTRNTYIKPKWRTFKPDKLKIV